MGVGGWGVGDFEIEVNIGPPSGEAVRKAGAGRREIATSRSLDI